MGIMPKSARIFLVRYSLQNAASVSGLLLTTEALVAEQSEKKRHRPYREEAWQTSIDGNPRIRA